MESLFSCPLCAGPLERTDTGLCCPSRHSFDRSAAGYVHLLPPNRKHSKNPGDDKEMVAARSAFLDKGYYAPLREALCELALDCVKGESAPVVVDSGCGEGYYTAGLYETLSQAGREPRIAGVDISKFALRRAAKRLKEGEFAVASVYHLPVEDEAVDVVVDCFAPLALEEYRRVLRPGGLFVYVVPAPLHLMEMKAVLYDTPYPNPEERAAMQLGLELCEKLKSFLEAIQFTGFSNFDIKYDQRDGKFKAFEINCRQGRSNYYVTGSGHNIATYLVGDLIEGKDLPLTVVKNQSLWRMIPRVLAYEFIPKNYHPQMKALIRLGADHHSMEYRPDYTLGRVLRVWKNHIGNIHRFRKYCKKPQN